MTRESRYLIFKIEDNKPLKHILVDAESCPEYGQLWKMIEDRGYKINKDAEKPLSTTEDKVQDFENQVDKTYFLNSILQLKEEQKNLASALNQLHNFVQEIRKDVIDKFSGTKDNEPIGRFCFMKYPNTDKYHIIDKNNDHKHDALFSLHQAKETCRILNLIAKEK